MSSKSVACSLTVCSALAMFLISPGCAAESSAQALGAKLRQALEATCAQSAPDVTGDVFAILSSSEPIDPAEPENYGSDICSGVIFEFDNPDLEPLRGAWVQASGSSHDESDAFSEGRCTGRGLQADYWGYKDNEWTKLADADVSANFVADSEQSEPYCDLNALLPYEESFEKLRVVARVTEGSQTYPMQACVW